MVRVIAGDDFSKCPLTQGRAERELLGIQFPFIAENHQLVRVISLAYNKPNKRKMTLKKTQKNCSFKGVWVGGGGGDREWGGGGDDGGVGRQNQHKAHKTQST